VIELNEEICEFIGALIGDGYIGNYGSRKQQYLIGLVGHNKLDKNYFVDYLYPLIKRNFNFVNPHIYYRSDENTIRLVIYSKRLFMFLTSLGMPIGKKSRIIKIPQKILEKESHICATIRGIFDTDGCVFLDRRLKYKQPYPRLVLQSASIPLIEQLENYLGNYFTLYVKKNNRDGYRNNLEIYGHQQLESFLKRIGLSNQRHLSRCPHGLAVRFSPR
jgi:intein/homing endonuclease